MLKRMKLFCTHLLFNIHFNNINVASGYCLALPVSNMKFFPCTYDSRSEADLMSTFILYIYMKIIYIYSPVCLYFKCLWHSQQHRLLKTVGGTWCRFIFNSGLREWIMFSREIRKSGCKTRHLNGKQSLDNLRGTGCIFYLGRWSNGSRAV